jgi:hypothetical protein
MDLQQDLAVPVTTVVDISDIKALNNGLPTIPFAVANGMGGIVVFNAEDVNVTNCDAVGNILTGILGIDVVKVTVDNCHCDDTLAGLFDPVTSYAGGIEILASATGSRDIVVRNTTCNRTAGELYIDGLGMGNPFGTPARITNVVIDNVQANDIQAFAELEGDTGAEATGIDIYYQVDNVRITNCQANNAQTTITVPGCGFAESYGIYLGGGNTGSIDACEIVGNIVTTTQPLRNIGQSIGIGMGQNNFSVTNCQSGNHVTQNLSSTPFLQITQAISVYECSQGLIRNCQLNNCTNTSPVTPTPSVQLAEGLDIGICNDIIVEDCVASGNNQTAANPPGQSSITAGFKTSLCNRVVFRRCTSTNNTDSGTGLAFGFSTTEPISPGPVSDSVVFDSCVAEDNTGSFNNAGGFDIKDLIGSKVLGCVADRNTIGIKVSETVPGASGTNFFEGNILVGNLQAGIIDTTTSRSNAYLSNRAQSNGPTPAITNYIGLIFPEATCHHDCHSADKTPLRLWKLPNGPCGRNTNCEHHNVFDNISIER